MKQKYLVRVYLSSFYDVEVEAENLQDAKQIAESSEYWDMIEIGNNLALQEGQSNVLDNYEDIPAKTISVEWDTDGMDEEELDLPSEVEVPGYVDEDDIADYISDIYGLCVKSWYEI